MVKRARPINAATQASVTAVKVRRGDVRRAVIVRTRKAVRRPDGRLIRFDDNAAVLLNNKREMLGTRIGGMVNADLRMKGWGKIVSLAPKVSFPFLRMTVLLTTAQGPVSSGRYVAGFCFFGLDLVIMLSYSLAHIDLNFHSPVGLCAACLLRKEDSEIYATEDTIFIIEITQLERDPCVVPFSTRVRHAPNCPWQ